MAKKEGYRNYELEANIVALISNEKKDKGIAKDFTVNKAIEFFFKNRMIEGDKYKYSFDPNGRKSVYIYLKSENNTLLEKESELTGEPFNRIVNESVKFYIKNIK